MTPEGVLREAASRGIVLRAEGGRVKWTAPAGALDDALRQAIREWKQELLAVLAPPGLPLKPPGYEVPPEWRPAPPWTPEEEAEYGAVLGEMARVLDDGELIEWLGQQWGARLYVDARGLRAENAAAVPAAVRSEVRRRQGALVALLGNA